MSYYDYRALASSFSVTKVDIETNAEASDDEIKKWEEKNRIKAPEDLKNFYLTSNGLQVTWNGKYGGWLNKGRRVENSLCLF